MVSWMITEIGYAASRCGCREDRCLVLSLLRPRVMLASIYDIDLQRLSASGIRGMILDLDNTIAPWHSEKPASSLVQWLRRVQRLGLRSVILSNNRPARVRRFARQAGIPFVADARKPTARKFRVAMQMIATEPQETAVVGDQMFTDILGGNRLGLYTILVQPMATEEFVGTKALRHVERAVLRHFPEAQRLHLPGKSAD